MQKKLVILLILLVAILITSAITGCNKKKDNVLRVGTNAEYPPFESKDGESFVGVDMDLARKIAEKMDMEVQIIDMEFDTLIPSLGAGKIDMAISAITITDERKAQVDFSLPYYVANQVIIAKQDNTIVLDKIEDIVKYRVGAQNGTTGQIYISEKFIDTKMMDTKLLQKYPTNIEAITDLMNGNLDFVIIDDSAAQGYSQLKPIATVLELDTNESYGIALPKNAELNAKINAALKELIDGGEMTSIIQTHIK